MLSKSKKRLIERLKRPRLRKREGLVLAEGPRVVAEALRSELGVRGLWMEATMEDTPMGASLVAAAVDKGIQVVVVEDGALKGASDTDSPQSVLGIVEEPVAAPADSGGSVLLLDSLQDPGNVGTLIRSAWALGLAQVWTTPGCSDPWGSKAVRASAGAVFHMDVVALGDVAEALEGSKRALWVAEASGTPIPRLPEAGRSDWVLAVGNEGAGVSPAVQGLGTGVSIPMTRGADSLNVAVAGSILMYVLVQADRDRDP